MFYVQSISVDLVLAAVIASYVWELGKYNNNGRRSVPESKATLMSNGQVRRPVPEMSGDNEPVPIMAEQDMIREMDSTLRM